MPVAPLSKTHAILNEFIRKLLFGHFADFSSRREQSVSDASHLRTKNPSQLYEHTRTTIHGSACDTARRSRETTRPLRVAPTSPVHTLFLAQSLFRRATQNGSQCSPRPRFTLSWPGRSPRSLSESSHSLRPMPRPASTVLRRSCLACKSGSKRLKHTCTKAKGTPALNPAPPLPFNHKYIYTPSNRSRVGTSWQTCLLCETVNEPDGLADRQFLDCPLTSLPCSAYNCTRVERACT